jgi:hypothetical protein
MKMTYIILISLLAIVVIVGCGLVSGTVFISQGIDGTIHSQNPASTLNETIGHAKVDLTNNDDWGKVDIDGLESMCTRITIQNHRTEPVSGEVWVVPDTNAAGITNLAQIQSHGGFRVFHGMLVPASNGPEGGIRTFTCSETLSLVENLDRLTVVVRNGRFTVWGIGDQDQYSLTYSAMYLGMQVTGSL